MVAGCGGTDGVGDGNTDVCDSGVGEISLGIKGMSKGGVF